MAVDPRAVSVFVVATEEAELEVHGALLANKIGRFVHEWSPYYRSTRVELLYYTEIG